MTIYINSKSLNYKPWLLLLSLGGFLPFSEYNAILISIVAMRFIIPIFTPNQFDIKSIIGTFTLASIIALLVYHVLFSNYRLIWIIRYSFLALSLYMIAQCRIRISVKDTNLIALVVFAYVISDIIQLYTGTTLFLNNTNRTYGLTFQRIVFSDFIITLCILLIIIFETTSTVKNKYFIIILKLMCLAHVYMTGSRSFILILLFLIFYKPWVTSKFSVKLLSVIILISSLIILGIVNQRFSTSFDTSFGSNYSRMEFLNLGITLWKSYFYFGAGPGESINFLIANVTESQPAMHFDILLILSELGLIGVLLLSLLFIQLKNSKNIIILSALIFLSLQNSIYYTPYLIFIILAVESINIDKNYIKR
ncbi:Lipid A core - O-antigen ligase and related enzymes [Klebsiella pneumoniae]|uniref:O-antigen ligase family protein n=3 Tax=Morganella morganii TaxID=582 RepID=UPI000A900BFC|nr:Lipid A core - O-antigen ligase and related enzymes [Klebsiella pneumoniae]